MPKIVKEIPSRAGGMQDKYPWSEYFDGKLREFGADDFGDTTPAGFASSARAALIRLGTEGIIVNTRGDSVFVGPAAKDDAKSAPKKKSKKKGAASAEA